MSEAARLSRLREQYRKACEANEAAFCEAQKAFRVWDAAETKYVTARDEASRAFTALINAGLNT